MERHSGVRRGRRLRATVWSLLLCVVCAASALAQDANQELNMTDILRLPGTVLGEGANANAVGPFKARTFRVEEVNLPRPVRAEVGGRPTEVSKAFRVTIVGGPFPVRALPPVIWVDDVAVGFGVESEDLTEITAVTFDRAVLREGASLYLSYGSKEDKEDRTRLPEKLALDGPKGGRQ
ncbi:MAG TPA: hypothetical protein VGV38_15480 [Pyrinomonadaceae bacterium]|nr:hypothetical protein [Pyrinomonadaceae bacterium]